MQTWGNDLGSMTSPICLFCRSQQNESACASGRAACMELQRQSDVVEYIISHTDVLFCSTSTSGIGDGAGHSSSSGPKSVRVSSPATRLLSVEEAQAQRRGHSSSPALTRSTNIEVEEGPAAAGGKFHTVIDFPSERPSPPSKMKEPAAGSWCSCFSLREPSSVAKHQLQHNAREPSETEIVVVLAGESSPRPRRRARAYSDGSLCASINAELLGSTNRCSSDDSLPYNTSDGMKVIIQVEALISPGCAEDADLSLPETTVNELDCDGAPLQCSPAQAQPECPDSSSSTQDQVSVSEEEPSLVEGDVESELQSQAPGSRTGSEPPPPEQERTSPMCPPDLSPKSPPGC
ncbi:rho GTPase-activating protein 32-like isoform X1 [Gallus gallus]|uniref:rho GTPase-activating protein 32-like isoform X1 n=1 Tax=Gallus gallus TaxID=9031 RepID=UPI001AE2F886|nr:rho GTPase-activating protein 32-like isoform X1 [Gallus gallus]